MSTRESLVRRLVRNPVAVPSISWLLLVTFAAVLAPVLAPHDPGLASPDAIFAPPSAEFPLGADSSGRDVLSRMIYAGRLSLAAAMLCLAVAASLGVVTGLLAGYYRGRVETASSWTANLLLAVPGVVILLAARAALGPSVWASMIILGVLLAPVFYRVVAADVAAVREELYVDAARVSGLGDRAIISRHILGVVRGPAIILAAGMAGVAVAVQAGLDFLNLGDPNVPTWGAMLNDAFGNMYDNPFGLLWPTGVIGLTCIAFVLLGVALRDETQRVGPRPLGRRAAARARAADVGVADQREPATESVTEPGTEPGTEPATEPGTEPGTEPMAVHAEAPETPLGEPILVVSDLSVAYAGANGTSSRVVEDVSLTVRRGEVHGLIGESGSGKTQTAFAVLGLLSEGGRVTGGSLRFDGVDLAGLGSAELGRLRGRRLAYVPQEPMSNLDPSFTIGDQLIEPIRHHLGLNRAQARSRALDLLDRVGIADPRRTAGAYPHQISGGMAQRVLIAGAVSCDPDLLIADEPTTALDVTVQAEVLDLLRSLQAERQLGILLVTHNFGVVADLCDRVSVMRAGRIVETGPVGSIFSDPQHSYTRSLFDAMLEDVPARRTHLDRTEMAP